MSRRRKATWWEAEDAQRSALSRRPQDFKGIYPTTSCEGRCIPMVYGSAIIPGNVILLPQESSTASAGRISATMMIALSSTRLFSGGPSAIWHDGIKVFPGFGTIYDAFADGTQTTAWSYLTTPVARTYTELFQAAGTPNEITVSLHASFTANVLVERGFGMGEWATMSTPSDYTVSAGVYTISYNFGAEPKRVRITYTATAVPFGGLYTLSYNGTSYAAFIALDVGQEGQKPSVGDWKYELTGANVFPAADGGTSAEGGTVLLPTIAKDILTGYGYGQSCEWPESRIDSASWSTWRDMAGAHDLFGALALTEQRDASEILGEILAATNTDALWSDGVLKFVCNDHRPASQTVDAITYVYAPSRTPVADLTTADFLVDDPGDDPVTIEFLSESDVRNCWPVEYLDRNKSTTEGEWPRATVQEEDVADVETRGLRLADTTTAHFFTAESRARWYSLVLAHDSIYLRRTFRFRVGVAHWYLEPGDIVSLTDDRLLDGVLVGITSMEESGDTGELDVEAEDVIS